MKLEINDEVKLTKEALACDWAFGGTHKIIAITKYEDVLLSNEEKVAKIWLELVVRPKYKVGDWVRFIGAKETTACYDNIYFSDIKQIDKLDGEGYYIINNWQYSSDLLELVCGFTLNEEIELLCEDTHERFEPFPLYAKFYAYAPTLNEPYLVIDDNEHLESFKYARAIFKFKAYSEPKIEWLAGDGLVLVQKSTGAEYRISGIGLNHGIYISAVDDCYNKFVSLDYVFVNFTCEDGSPFGERLN